MLLLGLYFCFLGWGYEEDDIKEMLRLFFFFLEMAASRKNS